MIGEYNIKAFLLLFFPMALNKVKIDINELHGFMLLLVFDFV